MKPSVGRVVHYVSQEGGACTAAVVTEVPKTVDRMANDKALVVSLAVLHPWGITFNPEAWRSEGVGTAGTWHWPERVED